MMQRQTYTAGIVADAITLTPKAGSESKPIHLGAATIVVNSTASPPVAEFWDVNYEYIVTIERVTKTN